jgi:hypothetical protein
MIERAADGAGLELKAHPHMLRRAGEAHDLAPHPDHGGFWTLDGGNA